MKFFYGSKKGSVQGSLTKITDGKEISASSVEDVKGLLLELQELSAYAAASGESSFLELEATVVSIVKKRFPSSLRDKFSDKSEKAEDNGETINVAFVVSFLKKYYKSINRTFGKGSLSNHNSKLSSSNPSTSSSTSSSSSSKVSKSSSGPAKANVAAFDAKGGQRKTKGPSHSGLAPSQRQPQQQLQQPVCIYCGNHHFLNFCPAFTQISYEEKKAFLFRQKACFKCYESDHRAAQCPLQVLCLKCNGTNHNTLMHSDNPIRPSSVSRLTAEATPFTPSTDVNNRLQQLAASPVNVGQVATPTTIQASLSAVECQKGSCFRPIVAAKVNLGDKVVEAYCLVDTGSNRTVVTKSFQRKYGLRTRSEWITLNGLGCTSSGPREVGNLSLQSMVDPNYSINNVEVFVVDNIPVSGAHIARQSHVDAYPHLQGIQVVELPVNEVSILIGTDLAYDFAPTDVRKASDDVPVSFLCPFGWVLMGRADGQPDRSAWAAFASFQDRPLEDRMEEIFRLDFPEKASEKTALSQDDRRAQEILKDTCQFVNGQYQVGLLWKYDRETTASILPSSLAETTARSRTLKLAKRLANTPKLKQQVEKIVQDFIDKDLAEILPSPPPKADLIWYLPIVVVEEPHKDKPRYCLDCRAPSGGVSLNSVLLTGDGGVCTIYSAIQNARLFDHFATGDIEGFFHRIGLPEEDRDVLRFFRWIPGKEDELQMLRMKCNIFGSACSSTNATYALRQNTIDHGKEYPANVIETLLRAYVDDVPMCAPSESELLALGSNSIDLCEKGGFNLTKFTSNSRSFLASIPEDRRAKGFKDPDGPLPKTSMLGLNYDPNEDTFSVKVLSKKVGGGPEEAPYANTPANRREVLSRVMGIFDPLGAVSPFVVLGKKINQKLTGMRYDWDAPLPECVHADVKKWHDHLSNVTLLSIPRSFSLLSPNQAVTLHVFVDASWIAYGCVAYFVQEENKCVNWVSSRSRVSPEKETNVDVGGSTPRLELQAAVTGIELATQIQEEIAVDIDRKVFHTDSTTVFWWINNREAKYKVFVANRLNKIHLASSPTEWHHVPTDVNPADVVSRGAMPDDEDAWKLFYHGPDFLHLPEEEWPPLPAREATVGALYLEEDTQESTVEPESFVLSLLRRKSDINSVKRILAYVLKFISKCKGRGLSVRAPSTTPSHSPPPPPPLPSVDELQSVEKLMIKDAQRRQFGPEVDALKEENPRKIKRVLNRSASVLRQLQPFIDHEGIMRVGGRIERSNDAWESKHPIVLPYFDSLTNHFIYHIHEVNGHSGVEFTLAESRRRYWILKGRQAIKKVVWRCVTCRRIRGKPQEQMMAELPDFRVSIAQPFADTAVDLIGHYQVKNARKSGKAWIVIFVCMRTRAIYLDVIKSLEAQVFIDTLMRFHSFYPTLERLYSDQGTNLVGARNVLSKMIDDWAGQMHSHLAPRGISWKMVAPHGGHVAGAWERIVGVVKKSLLPFLEKDMEFEKFRTLVFITAGIVNRRPLTRSSTDPKDLRALTPAQFILPTQDIAVSSSVLPAEPLSGSALRRSHDTLRPLVDELWRRFQTEYVATLQRRTKRLSTHRNLAVGDLVLVIDELYPREHWPLAVITEVFPSEDGLVRRVLLHTAAKKELERDIRKVVLLEREGEGEKVDELVDGGGGGDGGEGDGGGDDHD